MSFAEPVDPFLPALYRVDKAEREAEDIATLQFVPLEGTAPAFRPGQFNMISVFGVGEIAISLSGDPAKPDPYVHTVRSVGAISDAITRLDAGRIVGLRGPFGVGWPMTEARGRDVVVVAGGLGLAPLRPAIYELLAERSAFGRVIVLVGMREPEGILFRREIEEWRRHLDIDIEVTVDRAGATWRGHVGVVPALIGRVGLDPAKTIAMICGPEVMMRFAVTALQEAGVGDRQIFLSMERNMKCAIGLCGHCQFGPYFVCKDGPVFRFDRIAGIFAIREI